MDCNCCMSEITNGRHTPSMGALDFPSAQSMVRRERRVKKFARNARLGRHSHGKEANQTREKDWLNQSDNVAGWSLEDPRFATIYCDKYRMCKVFPT
jgi:hypothetical protein